jgi:hypothetical protein
VIKQRSERFDQLEISFFDDADWYFEGWTVHDGYRPEPGVYQVRGYIEAAGSRTNIHLGGIRIQHITSSPDTQQPDRMPQRVTPLIEPRRTTRPRRCSDLMGYACLEP